MTKSFLLFAAAYLSSSALLSAQATTPVRAQPPARGTPNDLHHRVVVVDAGHGGPDGGMSGPLGAAKKVREKDITLAVALQLQQALEARGVSVVMTRSRDTLIALHDRGKIANTAKGDLFNFRARERGESRMEASSKRAGLRNLFSGRSKNRR